VFFKVRVDENSRTFQVANKNLDMIKEYVYKKHALELYKAFEYKFYQHKMISKSLDYKLGYWLARPWYLIKKIKNAF